MDLGICVASEIDATDLPPLEPRHAVLERVGSDVLARTAA